MLSTVRALFERLNDDQIRYCHWKSNRVLEETLEADTDIDILVERERAPVLRELLQQLGFKPAIELGVPPFPAVEHYHALDDESGRIVHVHAYYRVISGDSLAKNYHLPVEEMLFAEVERIGPVNVPSKGAELVVFVLRMLVKHATCAELALMLRAWGDVRREAQWLATDEARTRAPQLLATWLPGFDPRLFDSALGSLLRPGPLWRRIILGRRVRAELRPYARRGRAAAWIAAQRTIAGRAVFQLRGSKKGLAPSAGGAVIAFVGSEATGKSTMLDDVERWLGRHYTVERVHAGKPRNTPLTTIPNVLLPALRRLLPEQRSTRVAGRSPDGAGAERPFPLAFGIRSVLLAYDRRALLSRAFARAANGRIVLCDRYPAAGTGAIDGAQLGSPGTASAPGGIRAWLAAREARLYREIPAPDLVVYLTAPLEVTLERNRARSKTEPEEYVRWRHARSSTLEFDHVRVVRVDTARPIETSAREIRRLVWEAL